MSKSSLFFQALATVIESPTCDLEKVQAAINRVGQSVSNQDDLLYIRAVLVTTGANDNKDFFDKDELWAARLSPIDKPINWDHDRKQIVGHIYSVVAKTIDGQEMDIESDIPRLISGEAYSGDYELVIEGVVYSLQLPEFAEAIQARASQSALFVSMEAWFDDFDYVLWDDDEGSKADAAVLQSSKKFTILSRKDNRHLQEFLPSTGGDGKFENKNIGRKLKSILFGGVGFVGIPANPRSIIEKVGNADEDNDETGSIADVLGEDLPSAIEEIEVIDITSKDGLFTEGSTTTEDLALDQEVQMSDHEKKLQELRDQVETLQAEKADVKKELEITKADAVSKNRHGKLDTLFKAVAQPEEISEIDGAIRNGEDSFTAKLAFIAGSLRRFARAERALVEAQGVIEEYTTRERMRDVTALNLFTEKELNKQESKISGMTDDEFELWINERKEIAELKTELETQKKELESAAKHEDDAETEETVEEETEEDAEEAAIAALDKAEPEKEADLSKATEKEQVDDSQDIWADLAESLSDTDTPRVKRFKKKRSKQLGR